MVKTTDSSSNTKPKRRYKHKLLKETKHWKRSMGQSKQTIVCQQSNQPLQALLALSI